MGLQRTFGWKHFLAFAEQSMVGKPKDENLYHDLYFMRDGKDKVLYYDEPENHKTFTEPTKSLWLQFISGKNVTELNPPFSVGMLLGPEVLDKFVGVLPALRNMERDYEIRRKNDIFGNLKPLTYKDELEFVRDEIGKIYMLANKQTLVAF